MPNDAIVSRIADGRPEGRGTRPIDLNQNGYSRHSPCVEYLLDMTHESARDSLTTVTRMYDETVHVPTPPVEGTEQCSDDLVIGHRQHQHSRGIRSDTSHDIQTIRRAHARARLLPEPEDSFRIAGCCRSEIHGSALGR
jgi:hypothetical protein